MKKIKPLLSVIAIILIMCMCSGCDQIVGIFGRGNFGNASVPEADVSNLPDIEGVDFAYEIEYFNSTMRNVIVGQL